MPRNSEFTEKEVVKVWSLLAEGKKHQQIADQIGRSRSGVTKLIKKKENFRAKKRRGQPKSPRD
jgi:DNA-binding NarL/FixJ family response regulator